MRLRALRDACLGGFLYSSLLYGAVLSLVHVVHNHLGSARDALITYAVFLLLYGLWGAAFFGLASLVSGLSPKGGPVLGLFAFNLVFWEAFFLYGLTYDQAPLRPRGAFGMATVLLGLAILIAVAVAVASFLVFLLLKKLWDRGRLEWAVLIALLAGPTAPAAAPLYAPEGSRPPRPRPPLR